jgi:hypothetical protein
MPQTSIWSKGMTEPWHVEVTVFTKTNGPLSKHIELSADGKIVNDSSMCGMANGTARRVNIDSVQALAGLISGMHPNEAYSKTDCLIAFRSFAATS